EPGRAPAVFPPPASGARGKMLYWIIPTALGVLLLIVGLVFREKLFGPKDAVPARQEETAVQEDKTPPAEPIVQQPEPAGGKEPEPAANTGGGQTTTPTQTGGGAKKPADLVISDWRFYPDPPVQGERTQIS